MRKYYWLLANVLSGSYHVAPSEALPVTPDRVSDLIGGTTMKSYTYQDTNEICLHLYQAWNRGRYPSNVASKEATEHELGLIRFRCYDTRPQGELARSCLTEGEVRFSEFFYLQCNTATEDVVVQTYEGAKFKRRSAGRSPFYGRCVPKDARQPPSGPRTNFPRTEVPGPSPARKSSIDSVNLRAGQVACVEKSAAGVDRHVEAWIQKISSDASSVVSRISVPWMSLTEVSTMTAVSTHDSGFLSINTDPSGKPKVYRACAHQASGRPNVMLSIDVVSA